MLRFMAERFLIQCEKIQKNSSRHRQCNFDFCNLEISRQIEVVNHSTLNCFEPDSIGDSDASAASSGGK